MRSMHEYANPQATMDIVALMELFGPGAGLIERSVVEDTYSSLGSFEPALQVCATKELMSRKVALKLTFNLALDKLCTHTSVLKSSSGRIE